MLFSFEQFQAVDLRSGTVVKVEFFEKAKKPAFKVWVDFGPEIGIKQTSAQITVNYTLHILIGKNVIGCVNVGTKNIAGFISEFLLVGFSDPYGAIVLAVPDKPVTNGQKLH